MAQILSSFTQENEKLFVEFHQQIVEKSEKNQNF